MKKRGQSAMEFLMTYGWAILVVLIILSSLYFLGIFSPKIPSTCNIQSPFICNDFKITEDGITFLLSGKNVKVGINNVSVSINNKDYACIAEPGKSIENGGIVTYYCGTLNLDTNKVKTQINIKYQTIPSNIEHSITGEGNGIEENGTGGFNLLPTEPIPGQEESQFAPENSEAVGILASDGTYLYGKSWSSYDENDLIIAKLGSGYGGTTEGIDYGDVATAAGSLSLTYIKGGYLLNGYTTNGLNLQRINIDTREINYLSLNSRLIDRQSGNEITSPNGNILITSNENYIFVLSYRDYDKFKYKIYDLNGNFVKEINTNCNSYYTDGVFADSIYIYAIKWSGQITRMRINDGYCDEVWVFNNGERINGQFDWINNKVWIGGLYGNYIYKYDGWH